MKKKIVIGSIVTLLIALIAFQLIRNKSKLDENRSAKEEKAEVLVSVAKVESKILDRSLNLVGTTAGIRETSVITKAQGIVSEVLYKAGDYVKEGQVLVKLEDVYQKLQYQQAELNYSRMKDDLERYEKVYAGQGMTETQYRDVKLGEKNAKITLDQAKKQLEDTRITAPFSGFITAKNVNVGNPVSFQVPVAEMIDISKLIVNLNVSEQDAYVLREGMEADVTSDLFADKQFKGKIRFISRKGDIAHSYPIEIEINNDAKNSLKSGTIVNIYIPMATNKPTLVIPREALTGSVKEPSVYVVENQTAKIRKITLGRDFGQYLEVLSGLDEGASVVVNGQINLYDNCKVKVR